LGNAERFPERHEVHREWSFRWSREWSFRWSRKWSFRWACAGRRWEPALILCTKISAYNSIRAAYLFEFCPEFRQTALASTRKYNASRRPS
jgi:hypothetical protein